MAELTFKIEGLDAFMRNLDEYSNETKKRINDAVISAAFLMQSEAMKNLSNNGSVKTGSLVKSIQVQPVSTGNLFSANVMTNIQYASYVEYGTAAHEIRATNAKVLTDGKNFFGKVVQHPGTKPKPYFGPAFETAKGQLLNELNDIVNG